MYRLFGYERVYLPLCKVADTPFHIQGDDIFYIQSTIYIFTTHRLSHTGAIQLARALTLSVRLPQDNN